VYFGGTDGAFDDVPDATLVGEVDQDLFGGSVAGAGDVNADGYDDLLVGARQHGAPGLPNAGRAYLYLGGPGAFSTTPDVILDGAAADDHFGHGVTSIGDANGDGYADIAVGAFFSAASTGRVYVYFGGPGASIDTVADGEMVGEQTSSSFGAVLGSAGDLDDDGFSDLVVAARDYDGTGLDVGRAYIYMGAAGTSLDAGADMTMTGAADYDYYGAALSAADFNADGHVDLAVGAYQAAGLGRALVYFGSAGGLSSTPAATLIGYALNGYFGFALSGAGDVDGDGSADLIVGAPYEGGAGNGSAYLFLGGAGSMLNATPDVTFTGASGAALGLSVY
jgi:hypothetical protein